MSDLIHVLSLQRTDSHKAPPLLLHVEQLDQTKPLDLKLLATQGEEAFIGKISSRNLKSLKASNATVSDDELRSILQFTLLQHRLEGALTETLEGLEIVAVIKDSATIIIRKNIGGIIQRIASIELVQDEKFEDEIDTFAWAGIAVTQGNKLREELEAVQRALATKDEEVAIQKTQLESVIKMKQEHDEEMMQKFAALLDAKKRMIRSLRSGKPTHEDMDISSPRASKRKAIHERDDVDMEDAPSEHAVGPDEDDDDDDATLQNTESEGEDEGMAGLPPERELPFQHSKPQSSTLSAAQSNAQDDDEDDDETDDEL